MLRKPAFILSIDLELLWGFQNHPLSKYIPKMIIDKTYGRGAIGKILRLLEKYEIPATWAIVGNLFLKETDELGLNEKNKIKEKISKNGYLNRKFKGNILDDKINQVLYGKDIVDKIISNPIKHEIACHSFSHIDFSRCNREVADQEIKRCLNIGKKFNLKFDSFVFPENKIGYLDILEKYGFKIFRGKNNQVFYNYLNHNSLILEKVLKKIIAPPVKVTTNDGLLKIPSSMFFFDPFLKSNILFKAFLGIKRAEKQNAIFHMYIHPHNFTVCPSLIRDFERFLVFLADKKQNNKITVLRMQDILI